MNERPTLKRLSSGYWHARWSDEIWAQWPAGSVITEEAFFHNTATPQRIAQCYEALAETK